MPRGARRRLHRRVRSADAGRRQVSRRQARLQGAVRLRRARSRRGAAADRRRRGDDSQQGRGRQRQHRRGGAPHARDHATRSPNWPPCRAKNWSRARAISARRWNSCARSRAKGKLPVVLFCAGGVSTPADAALMMQLGAEGIFVGSGIFKAAQIERARRAGVRRGRLSGDRRQRRVALRARDRRRDDALRRRRCGRARRTSRSPARRRCAGIDVRRLPRRRTALRPRQLTPSG